jgi:serine/threonine-protein kinase
MSAPANDAAAPLDMRYKIGDVLARGRARIVYRAIDRDLGREIVIKVLSEEFRDRPDSVRRLVEQTQITSQLQHPGIPPIHDIGRLPDGRPYFTMKLAKGRTLAALLAERADPAADRPRFLVIALNVAQTLAYAHYKGVIHRDLEPANIMVGAFGEVQVMGWGLAKVLSMESATEPLERSGGSTLGTLPYASPEQARRELERVDRRIDVFGLGAILCEVLTGQPPFIGTGEEVKVQAQTGNMGPARQRLEASGADSDLITLVRSCLSARQEDRPADAGQVAKLLAAHSVAAEKRLREVEANRVRADAIADELQKTQTGSTCPRRGRRPACGSVHRPCVEVRGRPPFRATSFASSRRIEAGKRIAERIRPAARPGS